MDTYAAEVENSKNDKHSPGEERQAWDTIFFADDVKLHVGRNSILQNALNNSNMWTTECGMVWSTEKWIVLQMEEWRGTRHYRLAGNEIKKMEAATYLEMTKSNDGVQQENSMSKIRHAIKRTQMIRASGAHAGKSIAQQ